MEQSSGISMDSVAIFEDATRRLAEVTHAIGEITGLNDQVATAAEEQTSVADDIARDVAQVAEQADRATQIVSDLGKTSDLLKAMAQRNLALSQRFTGLS